MLQQYYVVNNMCIFCSYGERDYGGGTVVPEVGIVVVMVVVVVVVQTSEHCVSIPCNFTTM